MLALEELRGHCPYCGEEITLLVDSSIGAQRYIEDCTVCCRPIQVDLSEEGDGTLRLSLRHEDQAD